MSQFGIDPSSGSFKSAMRKVATDKARAKSGQTTAARERAEQESFSRLTTGMNARSGAFAQPGVPGAQIANVPLQKTGVPGGPGFVDPARGAQGFGAMSGAGAQGISTITKGSTTKTSGGDDGFGQALGATAGYLLTS